MWNRPLVEVHCVAMVFFLFSVLSLGLMLYLPSFHSSHSYIVCEADADGMN